MSLAVTGHDNRGTEDVPYGFVYFNDDRRVAYTSEHGVVERATGGWGVVSAAHVKAAKDYLKSEGVKIPTD